MDQGDSSGAKIVKYIGWAIVLFVILYYGYAYIDIYSDVSVRAYAPLVLVEGAFWLLIGVIFLVVAWRLDKKAMATKREG